MTTQTAEMTTAATIQGLLRNISALPADGIRKLSEYAEELIEELEDEEDIAYIEAHKDEPTIPLSEVIKEFEAKYGPLN
jgi:hypothetical protein